MSQLQYALTYFNMKIANYLDIHAYIANTE